MCRCGGGAVLLDNNYNNYRYYEIPVLTGITRTVRAALRLEQERYSYASQGRDHSYRGIDEDGEGDYICFVDDVLISLRRLEQIRELDGADPFEGLDNDRGDISSFVIRRTSSTEDLTIFTDLLGDFVAPLLVFDCFDEDDDHNGMLLAFDLRQFEREKIQQFQEERRQKLSNKPKKKKRKKVIKTRKVPRRTMLSDIREYERDLDDQFFTELLEEVRLPTFYLEEYSDYDYEGDERAEEEEGGAEWLAWIRSRKKKRVPASALDLFMFSARDTTRPVDDLGFSFLALRRQLCQRPILGFDVLQDCAQRLDYCRLNELRIPSIDTVHAQRQDRRRYLREQLRVIGTLAVLSYYDDISQHQRQFALTKSLPSLICIQAFVRLNSPQCELDDLSTKPLDEVYLQRRGRLRSSIIDHLGGEEAVASEPHVDGASSRVRRHRRIVTRRKIPRGTRLLSVADFDRDLDDASFDELMQELRQAPTYVMEEKEEVYEEEVVGGDGDEFEESEEIISTTIIDDHDEWEDLNDDDVRLLGRYMSLRESVAEEDWVDLSEEDLEPLLRSRDHDILTLRDRRQEVVYSFETDAVVSNGAVAKEDSALCVGEEVSSVAQGEGFGSPEVDTDAAYDSEEQEESEAVLVGENEVYQIGGASSGALDSSSRSGTESLDEEENSDHITQRSSPDAFVVDVVGLKVDSVDDTAPEDRGHVENDATNFALMRRHRSAVELLGDDDSDVAAEVFDSDINDVESDSYTGNAASESTEVEWDAELLFDRMHPDTSAVSGPRESFGAVVSALGLDLDSTVRQKRTPTKIQDTGKSTLPSYGRRGNGEAEETLTETDLLLLRDGCDWDAGGYLDDLEAPSTSGVENLWHLFRDPSEGDLIFDAEQQLLDESSIAKLSQQRISEDHQDDPGSDGPPRPKRRKRRRRSNSLESHAVVDSQQRRNHEPVNRAVSDASSQEDHQHPSQRKEQESDEVAHAVDLLSLEMALEESFRPKTRRMKPIKRGGFSSSTTEQDW